MVYVLYKFYIYSICALYLSIFNIGSDILYTFLHYPITVWELATEIKKVFNDYYLRHIDEEQLHTCVLTWVDNCPNKLFKDNDINPTVKAVIGKNREFVLKKIIDNLCDSSIAQ